MKALSSINSIKHPSLTQQNWREVQPCRIVQIFGRQFLLTQPASSFWVYLLGLQTTWIGIHFFRSPYTHHDLLWGISLVLWGIGALIAGTSYQAFGYYIKCHGRADCRWTSGWEITYLILQQLSVNAMLAAVFIDSTTGILRNMVLGYGITLSLLYPLSTLYWTTIPKPYFLTFEYMAAISTPAYLFLLAFNGWNYIENPNSHDSNLWILWISLFAVMGCYLLYGRSGIPERLWKKKLWFSDNDLLHLGLILWMAYLDHLDL